MDAAWNPKLAFVQRTVIIGYPMGEKPPAGLEHSFFKCIMHHRNMRLQTSPNPSGPSPLAQSQDSAERVPRISVPHSELLNSVPTDTIKCSSLTTPHLPSHSFSSSLHTWLLRDFDVLLSEILTHHTSLCTWGTKRQLPCHVSSSCP